MRTSASSEQRGAGGPGARGFTLIEMLVTLVIMGLLAGLASLSVGGSTHRAAREEAERLVQVLGFASEEAGYQGEEYGVLVEDDRYAVLRFDPDAETWSESTERQLAPHTLPGNVRIGLVLGEAAELPQRGRARRDSDAGGESLKPEVLILSSGEITPFDIEFRAGDGEEPAARVRSDGSGNLSQE
jgi:general secretion pathway protein H